MQIRVKCGCGISECVDWALLDLQGTLQIQTSAQHLSLHNLPIGSLCRAQQQQDKFYFTVGYHELEGKKVPLKKPLLVLKKVKRQEDPQDMEQQLSLGTPFTQYPTPSSGSVELHVIGIIRHKILFKNRPKALISKPEVKRTKQT